MPGLSCGTRRPGAYLCGALYRGRVPRHVSARAKTHRNASRDNACVNAHVARRRRPKNCSARCRRLSIRRPYLPTRESFAPKQRRDVGSLLNFLVARQCFDFPGWTDASHRMTLRARARARARISREIIRAGRTKNAIRRSTESD